jgi:hypothetical protein
LVFFMDIFWNFLSKMSPDSISVSNRYPNHIESCVNVFTCTLLYSQIWLNCHFWLNGPIWMITTFATYITKFLI